MKIGVKYENGIVQELELISKELYLQRENDPKLEYIEDLRRSGKMCTDDSPIYMAHLNSGLLECNGHIALIDTWEV